MDFAGAGQPFLEARPETETNIGACFLRVSNCVRAIDWNVTARRRLYGRRGATPVSDMIQSPSLDTRITCVLEGQPDPLKCRDIEDVVALPVESQPSHLWITWSLGGGAVLT